MKLNDIYDLVLANIKANFSTKTELRNPYTLDDNSEHILNNGFGIVVGPSTVVDQLLGRVMSVQSDLSIKLTRKTYNLDKDSTVRRATEKQLQLDKLNMIIDLRGDSGIKSGTAGFRYIGDGGIVNVFGEKNNFLSLEVNFRVDYFETLEQ